MNTNNTIRIDKWLWSARFFKTRDLATTAIKNGRVLINSQRCKPSHGLTIGDHLIIQKTNELRFEIIVNNLAEKRVSAKQAVLLYEETIASIEQRAVSSEKRQLSNALVYFPENRPDKRHRRMLRDIRHSF